MTTRELTSRGFESPQQLFTSILECEDLAGIYIPLLSRPQRRQLNSFLNVVEYNEDYPVLTVSKIRQELRIVEY